MASNRVYLLLLSGELAAAEKWIAARYPECECVVLQKREFRELTWRGQIRALRRIEGTAFVFFTGSLSDLQEPRLTVWSALFHRCRSTVLADLSGNVIEYGAFGWLRILPGSLVGAFCDLITFAGTWLLLQALRRLTNPIGAEAQEGEAGELIYLHPYPMYSGAGGAMSHIQGFLSGVAALGRKCEIFWGRALAKGKFPAHLVPPKRSLFLFRESHMLSYNLRFVIAVRRVLRGRKEATFYQRHGRFVFAGALLSWILRVPLVLEYNASELRMADYGDPVRLRTWLHQCEEVSLRAASVVVVVSEVLKKELLERGLSEKKIVVNPNGVDPDIFRPDCGGSELRSKWGWGKSDVVAAFVGTFSYWHGIEVLAQAIQQLLVVNAQGESGATLRFLLVGDGPLCAEIRQKLLPAKDRVRFTGLVPHERVPAYLDAADILLSPHVPMPDGRPFFGSPTKLFEYMAMSKAIIASKLDQLSIVLEHEQSAWLVEPGSPSELASAVALLAQDAGLRQQLGRNARAAALAGHTWQQNAARVLARVGSGLVRDTAHVPMGIQS